MKFTFLEIVERYKKALKMRALSYAVISVILLTNHQMIEPVELKLAVQSRLK
jgi:hypothetical protein